MRLRQQHEGQTVAMVGAVQQRRLALVPVEQPGVAPVRLAVHLLHEIECVGHLSSRRSEPARGQRGVEHEARAAHQMARAAVIDGAVVFEEMKAAAARIAHARCIERQGVAHVGQQRFRLAQVGRVHGGLTEKQTFSKRDNSSLTGRICPAQSLRNHAGEYPDRR
jgi:hypothetical protein